MIIFISVGHYGCEWNFQRLGTNGPWAEWADGSVYSLLGQIVRELIGQYIHYWVKQFMSRVSWLVSIFIIGSNSSWADWSVYSLLGQIVRELIGQYIHYWVKQFMSRVSWLVSIFIIGSNSSWADWADWSVYLLLGRTVHDQSELIGRYNDE